MMLLYYAELLFVVAIGLSLKQIWTYECFNQVGSNTIIIFNIQSSAAETHTTTEQFAAVRNTIYDLIIFINLY